MPNDGPRDIKIRKILPLAFGFLDLVLTELMTSGRNGEAQTILGNRFTHRKKPYLLRRATRADHRSIDSGADRREVISELSNRLRAGIGGRVA